MEQTQTTPEQTPQLEGAPVESLLTTPPATDPSATNEPPKEEAPAPEPFDLAKVELPEGLEIPEEVGKSFTELAGKYGLTNEAAKDLISLHAQQAKAAADAGVQAFVKMNETWKQEIMSDPVIGGDKLAENAATILKFLDDKNLIDPGFKSALEYTGAVNNPAVFRTLLKLAQAHTEGKAVAGTPPAQQKAPPTLAQAMYPNLPS